MRFYSVPVFILNYSFYISLCYTTYFTTSFSLSHIVQLTMDDVSYETCLNTIWTSKISFGLSKRFLVSYCYEALKRKDKINYIEKGRF